MGKGKFDSPTNLGAFREDVSNMIRVAVESGEYVYQEGDEVWLITARDGWLRSSVIAEEGDEYNVYVEPWNREEWVTADSLRPTDFYDPPPSNLDGPGPALITGAAL